MKLPLYASLRESYKSSQQNPNPCLLFDRFVRWGDSWKAEGPQKQNFFKEIRKATTNGKLLEDYLERQSRQVEALGGKILEGATTGRFVSGLGGAHPFEAGFVWHRTLGVPYIPGSSIKGAVRAWADPDRGWGGAEQEEVERLFGDSKETGAGALIVMDALPTKPPELQVDIVNPHYGEYYREKKAPADYLSPVPVPFLTVARGQGFRFALVPRKSSEEEAVERGANLLREALKTIGAGAKTAAGYGGFLVDADARQAPEKETATREAGDDPRFEAMRSRIETYKESEYGAVTTWVNELETLPAGVERRKLADQLHDKVYANKKRRKKMREREWFQKLQQMREKG